MTALQEQAVDLIKRLPDDKVFHVINILEGMESDTVTPMETQAQRAYQNLQKYRKSSPIERDYKAELNEALEEKYAGIDRH